MSLLYRLLCGLLGLLVRQGDERELEILCCATNSRSSVAVGNGPSTRPSTGPCSLRPAGCFRASAGPAFRSARRHFSAGTGRCSWDIGDKAVAASVVRRLPPSHAA